MASLIITIICLAAIWVTYRVATRHYRNCDGTCGGRY